MNIELLREISNEFLVPFFSGASILKDARVSSDKDPLVDLVDDNNIAFKLASDDTQRLVIRRRQPFSKEKDVVPETSVIEAFVSVLAEMGATLNGPLRRDLLSTFQRRVVARSVAALDSDESVLLSGIDQLANWANRLYEGSPISAAIGFRNRPSAVPLLPFEQFVRDDFAALLSNGHDTLLEFDFEANFLGHTTLEMGEPAPFCPYRQTPIALWTTKAERRVALTLNRLGEILVLRDGRLLFARRSGRWSFLTHRPVITQMGTALDRALRTSVYTSCLDASFARTGACIGVIEIENLSQTRQQFINREDNLSYGNSAKVRAAKRIISGKRFQNLDRRLRQELLAVDGAMVISHRGDILAVGAILRIPGGSTGGGRLAAAKVLGTKGLGIKISQDGAITGFRRTRDEPTFRIM